MTVASSCKAEAQGLGQQMGNKWVSPSADTGEMTEAVAKAKGNKMAEKILKVQTH